MHNLVVEAGSEGGFFTQSGDGDRHSERPDDSGGHRRTSPHVESRDDIRNESPVPVREVSEPHHLVVACQRGFFFGGITNGVDVGITRALLVVYPDSAGSADTKPSLNRQCVVGGHADG